MKEGGGGGEGISFPPPPRCFTCAIFRAAFDSCSSFFAPKPHRNACYAGYRKTYSFPIVLKYQLENCRRANQAALVSGTGTRDELLRTSAGGG